MLHLHTSSIICVRKYTSTHTIIGTPLSFYRSYVVDYCFVRVANVVVVAAVDDDNDDALLYRRLSVYHRVSVPASTAIVPSLAIGLR